MSLYNIHLNIKFEFFYSERRFDERFANSFCQLYTFFMIFFGMVFIARSLVSRLSRKVQSSDHYNLWSTLRTFLRCSKNITKTTIRTPTTRSTQIIRPSHVSPMQW